MLYLRFKKWESFVFNSLLLILLDPFCFSAGPYSCFSGVTLPVLLARSQSCMPPCHAAPCCSRQTSHCRKPPALYNSLMLMVSISLSITTAIQAERGKQTAGF